MEVVLAMLWYIIPQILIISSSFPKPHTHCSCQLVRTHPTRTKKVGNLRSLLRRRSITMFPLTVPYQKSHCHTRLVSAKPPHLLPVLLSATPVLLISATPVTLGYNFTVCMNLQILEQLDQIYILYSNQNIKRSTNTSFTHPRIENHKNKIQIPKLFFVYSNFDQGVIIGPDAHYVTLSHVLI